MKKAIFVTLLCLSTMSFADTIKKDDSLICRKSNGDSFMGPASKLFKDGSVEISYPSKVDNLGIISNSDQGTIRIDASKCKVQKWVEDSNEVNKDVVCTAQGGFQDLGVSRILGTVLVDIESGKYIIRSNGFVSIDGEFQNAGATLLIDKKLCSIDETVDELNVSNISRAPGKEVPEVGIKFGNSFSKASKQ